MVEIHSLRLLHPIENVFARLVESAIVQLEDALGVDLRVHLIHTTPVRTADRSLAAPLERHRLDDTIGWGLAAVAAQPGRMGLSRAVFRWSAAL
jgi:hypothetical protein